jgi:hypothetical protein
MKKYKFYFVFFVILSSFIYFSCDDSGFIKSYVPKGIVSFSQKNLKHLDPNVDGVFELWLKMDSSGSNTYLSLGRFNISASGGVVNLSGNPMEFKYQGDTNKLSQAKSCLLTVEPPGDNNSEPSTAVLLSGPASVSNDSVNSYLTLGGQEALGDAGDLIMIPFHFYPTFVLSTPTSAPQNCTRGIWLCDTSGNSNYPAEGRIISPGWTYEMWVEDKSNPQNPIYYPTGRYKNPLGPDYDGAGPCAGTGTPYSKPGQDWIDPNCPSGGPQDINNGNYSMFITLEPSQEQWGSGAYNKPFFVKVYYKETIQSSCFRNIRTDCISNLSLLPEARVKITN